jgi:farnesyl-diphosphate farnesyltransferase
MRATNPREVGLIFREYARRIHTKAIPSDPNFIRVSVACGKVRCSYTHPLIRLMSFYQIEAWYEQNYPSFVHLSSNTPGAQFIEIDTSDRRAKVVLADQALDGQLKNRSHKSNGVNGHALNGVDKEGPPPSVNQMTSFAVGGYSLILILCMGFLWTAMK